MGGDRASSTSLSPSSAEEASEEWVSEFGVEDSPSRTKKPVRDGFAAKTEELKQNEGNVFNNDEYGNVGRFSCWDGFDCYIHEKRSEAVYEEIKKTYVDLEMRKGNLEEAKSKILSYIPGTWIEEVGGMRISDYELPKTTTLILIGPSKSGKSSLVNRISKVFEEDKFAPERAQVSSYYSSVEGGTYFLQEYLIPRGSNSFCLYDTRSLSVHSSDNFEMLKKWITKGVRHGELVIRDSDSRGVRETVKCKAWQIDYYSRKTRMVNFVIFVVNGLKVLNSIENADNDEDYCQMLATNFSCPYLSFKDDKPAVVVTHGDMLSRSDRIRVRYHLGNLLGIPPAKQIFDIPDKCDPATELTIVDMLRYSLEHADRNLPSKKRALDKVFSVLQVMCLMCIFLLTFYTAYSLRKHIRRASRVETHIDWHAIRHLWYG